MFIYYVVKEGIFTMIDDKRLAHCGHVAEKMFKAAPGNMKRDMYTLGLLHDIGYLYVGGGHAAAGGILMLNVGYKYWKEIYYHGYPTKEYTSEALDLLNDANIRTGPEGENMSYKEKLDFLAKKYGTDSTEYKRVEQLTKELTAKGFPRAALPDDRNTMFLGKKADLHIHTSVSDGALKPADAVRILAEEGHDVISITDYNSVEGVREAMDAGKKYGVKVVPGIELSTDLEFEGKKREVHILGYNIDTHNRDLGITIANIKADYRNHITQIYSKLKNMGYEIDWRDLLNGKPETSEVDTDDFERALDKKGHPIDDALDAVEQHVTKKRITTEDGIRAIRQAKGVPVLAHPMDIRLKEKRSTPEFYDRIEEIVKHLMDNGLRGIECFHPSASNEDSIVLLSIAIKNGLYVTQGSDFDGISDGWEWK